MNWKTLPFLGIFCYAIVGWGATGANGKTDSIDRNQHVSIAVGQEPSSMDPSLSNIGGDYTITENYAEHLLHKTPEGKLTAGLATSWEVSPDGKSIEVVLREGVKFHSGDPMTAEDVVFSIERVQSKNPTLRTRYRSIEKMEVLGDRRLRIVFRQPDVTFVPNRAVVVVSKRYHDRVGETEFIRQPVGTGPYRFVRHLPGEYVDLERYDEYWGLKPPVKTARFHFVPEDATRIAKLVAKEVDIVGSAPYATLARISKTPGLKIETLALNHPTPSIVFANRNPDTPWHDARVRRAIAYAVDRETMREKIFAGIPNLWGFLAPHELGYDPDIKPYPYDPARARSLLAEAGYPDGFRMDFYWGITGRWPMAREMAESIAAYLEAAGIKVNLKGEEWGATFARIRGAKKDDSRHVGIFGGAAGGPDPTYHMDLFFTSNGPMSVYSNPELDSIVSEARTTVDDNARAELIKKAVRIIHDEVASVPIMNMVAVYAMRDNVSFTPTKNHNMDLILVKDISIQ